MSEFFEQTSLDKSFWNDENIKNLCIKIILIRRQFVSDAFEAYYREIKKRIQAGTYEISCRLMTLFSELRPVFKSRLPEKEYEQLETDLNSSSIEDLERVWNYINHFLFINGLINIFNSKEVLLE